MGLGIAQAAALAGFDVIVHDASLESLERFEKNIVKSLEKGVQKGKLSEDEKETALQKIGIQPLLRDIQADFFIEAIVEDLQIKIDLFKKLAVNNPEAILASNTSSIPITQIASGLENSSMLVGMHFFNPAHIMKLVEVISGVDTDKKVVDATLALAEKFGKVGVEVKDSPGFIVNRVARHFYVESIKVLEEKVASIEGGLTVC